MTQFDRIEKIIENYNGIIQTSQVLDAGISKPVFYAYIKEKNLEQVAQGVYITKDAWVDDMYLLHLRCGQAIFSHETALFFHELTDREPMKYSVTVKSGYNPYLLKKDGIQVYMIKRELHEIGVITTQTPYGNTVLVYDMERTICDVVRSRSKMEIQTFQDALKQYVRRKDKNLRNLMKYAEMFHVRNILRQYLEVLL